MVGARFIEFSKYPCTRRCRTRRLHFSTASIYLVFFFHSNLTFRSGNFRSPFRLDSTPLSRSSRFPYRRLPLVFRSSAGSVPANDSRFLNFASGGKGTFLRGSRIQKFSWFSKLKTAIQNGKLYCADDFVVLF